MNNLQNDFLKRAISDLSDLIERAEKASNLPPEFVREAFRTLHTIKGTAQTFGFKNSSKIAHELENYISDGETSTQYLLEGLTYLVESFTNTETFELKKQFKCDHKSERKSIKFETEFIDQFSARERKQIISEANKGKKIFLVNVAFEFKDFAEKLKNLRETLSVKSEIIATLPGANENGKIGFRLCVASAETNFAELFEDFALEIVEQEPLLQNPLEENLAQIEAHAKELANKSGKEIEIEITADKMECSRDNCNLIFDILLHLTRNAIDHAFESKGKLEISVRSQKDSLKVSVKDDGKGIDTEKIKAKAIEKNIISPDKILTENELLDLIFLHEFSTAEVLTETSGRGIGLDAVKKIAENAGGTVHVKSRRNVGTIFEVHLRYEK